MKKSFFTVTLVTVFALFTGYNVYSSQNIQGCIRDIVLDDVEAVAACEVSPNVWENKGHCTKDINEKTAYCVENAYGPACCATI